MDRSDYPAIPASIPPGSSINILRDRVQKVTTLNAEIAGWLQERRKVEEAYIQGLQRLARSPIPGEASELGILRGPWSQIVNSSLALASSHQSFCRNLEREVERPISDFMTTNREWASFKTMEGNLTSVAKNIDASEAAVDKLKKKGKRAEPGRVAEAAMSVQNAIGEWESQAPFVFEKLQAMDEARINHLKESLIKMQTMEVDTASSIAQAMEMTMQFLLDINTMDEIKSWALSKAGPGGGNSATRERQRSRVGTGISTTPSIVTDDSGSVQSAGSNEKAHSGLGGNLKRLGTVLRGRGNRNSYIPPSPDAKASGGDRLGVGRHFGFGSASPNGSSSNLPPPTTQTSSLEPPDTTNSGYKGKSTASDQSYLQGPSSPVPLSPARSEAPRGLTPSGPVTEEVHKDAEGFSIPPPQKDLIPEAFRDEDETTTVGGDPSPAFKVEIRNDVIPEEDGDAEAAFSKVANTLKASQTLSKRTRGRRDGRNTIYGAPDALDINGFANGDYSSALGAGSSSPSLTTQTLPDAPLADLQPPAVHMPAPAPAEPITAYDYSAPLPALPGSSNQNTIVAPQHEAQPAPRSETSTMPLTGTVSGSVLTAAPAPSVMPLTVAALNSTMSPLAPFKMSRQTTLASDAGSDTQSVRSAHSVASHGAQAISHPQFHEPGLSVSIVESISVAFESGVPQKVSIIGEIAMAYNATAEPSASGTEVVRLDQNRLVEKIAPNPAFVSTAGQKSGEYQVSVAQIPRTSVAFKYQLRVDEQMSTTCLPIIITPVWKFEADQARLIISYKANPLYLATRPEVTTIRNLFVMTGVEGAQATACQSKPAGTFVRERSRIAWKIPELRLSADDVAGSKLIARFATEGLARSSITEVRWEISGEDAGKNVGSGLGLEVLRQGGGEKDPFADEVDEGSEASSEWKEAVVTRKLVSGKYTTS